MKASITTIATMTTTTTNDNKETEAVAGNIIQEEQQQQRQRQQSEQDEEHHQEKWRSSNSCTTRLMKELVHIPFAVLESDGVNALDIHRTFAPEPYYIVTLLKGLALVITLDVFLRDVLLYQNQRKSLYMAYLAHWALCLSLIYLLLSLTNSLLSMYDRFPGQPLNGDPIRSRIINSTWALFPTVLVLQIYATTLHWFFRNNNNDNNIDETVFISYVDCMKYGGLIVVLFLEGFVINHIPIRFRQMNYPIAALMLYILWTLIHAFHTDIGNPETDDNNDNNTINTTSTTTNNGNDDDAIYSYWNWKRRPLLLGFACAGILLFLTPIVFFILVCFSLPFRRCYKVPSQHQLERECGLTPP